MEGRWVWLSQEGSSPFLYLNCGGGCMNLHVIKLHRTKFIYNTWGCKESATTEQLSTYINEKCNKIDGLYQCY